MERVIWSVCRFLSAALLFSVFSGCDIPGCGPGEIPRNPISSNLVDFTVPASQSILRPSAFLTFEVYFLRAVSKESFSVGDDLAMCWLEPGETECDFADPARRVDVNLLFGGTEWSCYTSNVCRPESPDYNPAFSDLVELSVNAAPLTPAKYLLRILKSGSSPLASIDGHRLDDDVDIYLEIVSEDSPRERPQILGHSLGDYLNGAKFMEPHFRIGVLFDRPMGFINFLPSPLSGFNFRYLTTPLGAIGIKSDSIQGLEPGTSYYLDVLGDDIVTRGMPATMDRSGNTLENTLELPFSTSHVRILFPFHSPFSTGPDNWAEQLRVSYS